ncbi:hypothetical protein KJ782_06305 [Patescibacteria group bacterium]|nr:hypothetical protein [Patescibacteria group bacterium]
MGWEILFLSPNFICMKLSIIRKVNKIIKELTRKNKFNFIILDNWRGLRFIYDTEDVRNCSNQCQSCLLYKLFVNERSNSLTALYPASRKDKRLFGPQNYLNCKTLEQYRDCYVNFINLKANTANEIYDELKLVNNLMIVYSKDNNIENIEDRFKNSIINKAVNKASRQKRQIINNCWKNLKDG